MRRRGTDAGLAGVVLGLGAFVVSCGDPVVTGAGYNRPLFVFEGQYDPPVAAGLTPPRVGIVWIDPGQVKDDVPAPPESFRFETTAEGFRVSFYAPPPASTIYVFPDPEGQPVTSFAWGEIVLYDQPDAHDTFSITPRRTDPGSDAPDSEIMDPAHYLGAARSEIVRYLQMPLAAAKFSLLPEEGNTLVDGPLGYAVARIGCPPASRIVTGTTAPFEKVTMLIDQTPSKSLPFERACLRSHTVE